MNGRARLLRRALLFVVLSALLANGAMALLTPERWPKTAGRVYSWFFLGRQGMDSWDPMSRALAHVKQDPAPQKGLYEKLLYRRQEKPFQYPPSALLLPYGAEALLGPPWLALVKALTWLSVPAIGALTALLLQRGLGSLARGDQEAGGRAAVWFLAGLATFSFYPAMAAYRAGQIQAWLNAGFGAALWAWATGRPRLAGVLLGIGCLIKPQWAPLLLWGVLRKRWGLVAGFLAVTTVGAGLSLLLFGWAPHLEYLGALSFLSKRGESFYPNQSVNGLLNRLFMNGENLERPGFPPFHPWVYAGTLLTSSWLMAVALLGGRRAEEKGSLVDLALAGLTCTMASPIAWEHHYGMLLPIYAILLPRLAAEPVLGRRTLTWLGASYVLAGNLFTLADRAAATHWNFVQSHLFGGAVLALLLLHRLRGRASAVPTPIPKRVPEECTTPTSCSANSTSRVSYRRCLRFGATSWNGTTATSGGG